MTQHLTLQPLLHADIPVVSKITADAFLVDRHTVMKGLGKTPYNMEEISRSGLANLINSEKCVCMKAVHNETGEIMGWSSWGFRGFEPGEAPRLSTTEQEFGPRDKPVWKDEKAIADEKAAKADAAAGQKTNDNATTEESADDDDDIIKRLNAMEDEDMTQWMKKLMPEGTKCMFVVSFSVAPKFQKQGVGAALLKWGTDVADKFQVFAWVHSSVPAYKSYEKAGFETIGTLDLDLDEWAPAPPPKEEGEGAIWGRYLIRYMKRLPKKPE